MEVKAFKAYRFDEAKVGMDRDKLAVRLLEYGIETRPFFYPLHQQPPFKAEVGKPFPQAEWLSSRGLSLPTSNDIDFKTIDRVCQAIVSVLRKH